MSGPETFAQNHIHSLVFFFTFLLNFFVIFILALMDISSRRDRRSVVYCITVQGTPFAYPRHACIHSSGCPRVQALKAEQDSNKA